MGDRSLGSYFTLREMTVSETAARRGLPNLPGPAELSALTALVHNVLDPLRAALGRAVVVTSGYRSPEVNRLVKGSRTSQHLRGEAADIIVPGLSSVQVCRTIQRLRLPFDQLIEEFGEWTHVSYRAAGGRGEVLTARRVNGKVVYTPGLTR